MGHSPQQRPCPAAWFALGFLATISQVLLLRDFLVVCSGSELGIALLLFTWLAGIAAGAAVSLPLQRAVSASVPLPFVLIALALSCPAGLTVMRLADLMVKTPAGALAPLGHLAAIVLTAVFPSGLLVGLAFPLACAAESSAAGNTGGAAVIGRVYALEAAGSFSAGMVYTWLLVTLLPAMQTALLSAALLCLTAAWLPRRPGVKTRRGGLPAAGRYSAAMAGVLLLVCGITPWLGGRLDRLTLAHRWARLHPGIGLLETVETPYQRLEAGRLGDQTVFVANGSVLASYPDRYDATLWGHFVLSAHPAPRHVLLTGGLESGLLAAMLRHPGVEQIRCLEQDPALPALYRRYTRGEDRLALDDSRFTLTAGDGRRWINRAAADTGAAGTWDLIVVLLPDPTTAMINRYYTREFYANCRRLLRPGGILLCRVTASANYLDGEAGALARSVFATLSREFPAVRAAGGDRVIFAAANRRPGPGFFRVDEMVRHYEASGVVDPGFSAMAFHSLIEEERARFLEEELDRFPAKMVNSDWRPLAQAHTLRLWSRFSGDAVDRWFRLLFRPVPAWLVAAALVLPVLWALAPLVIRRRRGAGATRATVLTAVAAGGFAGLALELVCLHVFQGAFGNLYRMIGSVVALFMLGLALGGATAVTLGRRLSPVAPKGHQRVLALGLAGQALIALAAPTALRLAGSGHPLLSGNGIPETLVLLLVGAAGWCTGLALPAAGGVLIGRTRQQTGSTSALVNGADHLGAAAAAALVGLAAVPRLGVAATSGLLALVTSCCALRLALEEWAAGRSLRRGSR